MSALITLVVVIASPTLFGLAGGWLMHERDRSSISEYRMSQAFGRVEFGILGLLVAVALITINYTVAGWW